jgi:hypothetical protein
MGQAHDQPGRERPERKNARKQSNGLGPVTIGVCGAGFAPIRVEYRSSQGRAPAPSRGTATLGLWALARGAAAQPSSHGHAREAADHEQRYDHSDRSVWRYHAIRAGVRLILT